MSDTMIQPTQSTMKAIALDRFGGLETMKLQMLPVPEVGPDEVLIHVEWAGVGQWDPFEREGGFAKVFGIEPKFPYVLGSDGAGTVAAVGNRVKRINPGDRVYAFGLVNPKGGFYAEYAAVKADDVSRIPGKLTTQQAGAMPVDAMTALRGLDDTLGLKPAESVMIFGASGGIGHLAVQLAKRMGARVFAVASGSDGVALVKRLGADAVVDGHKDDIAAAARQFAPNGLDAALITAGGPAADKASPRCARVDASRIPTASNPRRSRRLELKPRRTTECPTRRRSRNSIASSNLRGRRGPCRSRFMSRGAFRLTRPPKRIGRLTSTILASLSCKRLSGSLTGCTTMERRAYHARWTSA